LIYCWKKVESFRNVEQLVTLDEEFEMRSFQSSTKFRKLATYHYQP